MPNDLDSEKAVLCSRVMPTIIAHDIIGVSPMVAPIGLIHEMRKKYNMKRSKFVQDIHDMHAKFGFHESVKDFDVEKLKVLLDFREKFQKEEYVEFSKAAKEFDAEEIVDGLIDTLVVAIGTLDLFGVDIDQAWDKVHAANMAKERGIKKERPNKLGMPDLIKPTKETHGYDWIAPDHSDNHGRLSELK